MGDWHDNHKTLSNKSQIGKWKPHNTIVRLKDISAPNTKHAAVREGTQLSGVGSKTQHRPVAVLRTAPCPTRISLAPCYFPNTAKVSTT